MTYVSVTFTLESGSLAVGPTPGVGNYFVTDAGVTLPVFNFRIRYAAESDIHGGSTMLAHAPNAGDLIVPLYAHAASAAALATMRANLDAACAYTGTIAVDQDGVVRTYTDRMPATPVWDQDAGMARIHLARAVVTIPVNPT